MASEGIGGRGVSLAFKLFAIDEASPVFARVAKSAEGAAAATAGTQKKTAAAMAGVRKFANVGAAAAVLVAGASLKMAADFQEGLTTLVTGAGESEKNLKMVGEGIKRISASTGESTDELIKGMFMIESAGFHGKAGLDILEKASIGARVGAASLGATANAVTTIMKNYAGAHVSATMATNAMVATVKQGKTHLEDLANAMATLSPSAALAGVSMHEMLGAMAELTSRGIGADKAATSLRFAILNLRAPNKSAEKEMVDLGLSANSVAKTLGKKGLAFTFEMLRDKMRKHHYSASRTTQALKNMTGGVRGFQAAMILSGSGLEGFKEKTKKIGEASGKTKKSIEGWKEAQKDLNVKFDKFKAKLKVVLITVGEKLIPVFSKVLDVLGPWIPLIAKVVLGLLALAAAVKLVMLTIGLISFLTSPIGLVVLAIAGLIAIVILLKKNWTKIWNGIKFLFGKVVGFLRGKWKWLILVLGPVGWLLLLAANWKKVWGGIKGFFKKTIDKIKDIWHNVCRWFKDRWSTVSSWISDKWHKLWNNIKNFFKIRAQGIKDVFSGLVSFARKKWNELREICAKPVRFVINTVLGGMAKVWNAVVSKVGLKALKVPVPHVGFAQGGYVNMAKGGAVRGAGGPTDDRIPAYLSNGEYVIPARVVKSKGVEFFDSLVSKRNARMATEKQGFSGGGGAGGIPGFFDIPNPIDVIKKGAKAVGKALTGAGGIAGAILGKIKDWTLGMLERIVVNKLIMGPAKALLGRMPGGNTMFGKFLKNMVPRLIKGMIDKLMKKNDDAIGNFKGGKIPAGQHKAIIMAALKAAHVPPPGSLAQWLAGLNTLITRESGWNASAVNKWDSNAKAGHPSGGLAQVIGPTFAAYRVKSLPNNVLNPVANVAAAIRYIVARYGNITKVQQANANLPPKGYALGGWTRPGWKVVGEHGAEMMWTPGRDKILSHRESRKVWGDRLNSRGQRVGGYIEVIIKTETGKEIERKLVKLKQHRGGGRMGWER